MHEATNLITMRNKDSGGDGTTASSGFVWCPTKVYYECPSMPIAVQLAAATPVNAELLEWAALPQNQPPQEWWDETVDPFARLDD